MQRALTIINNRVNGLGVSEATVQLENQNQAILVQIPGIRDPQAAIQRSGRRASSSSWRSPDRPATR